MIKTALPCLSPDSVRCMENRCKAQRSGFAPEKEEQHLRSIWRHSRRQMTLGVVLTRTRCVFALQKRKVAPPDMAAPDSLWGPSVSSIAALLRIDRKGLVSFLPLAETYSCAARYSGAQGAPGALQLIFRVPSSFCAITNGVHTVHPACYGTPEGTRTPNPQNRNLMLYPLSHRCVCPNIIANQITFVKRKPLDRVEKTLFFLRLSQNGDAGGGADAGCAGLDHGDSVCVGSDAAGGLDANLRAHGLSH